MHLTIHFKNGLAPVSFEPKGEEQATIDKVKAAVTEGTLLELTDVSGDQYVISGAAVGYFVVPSAGRQRVGFGR